jgi:long-chain fatty acid transport protein
MTLRKLTFLVSLAVLLVPQGASASGFEFARFGSDRGHAAAPTPFATYYNPAALSGTRRGELALDGLIAIRSASFDRTATTVPEPPGAEGANVGKTKLLDVLGGPAFAGSMRFGDLAIGLGAFAPMAGFARWQGNDDFATDARFIGARDGRARWHLIEGTTQAFYTSAALSYRFPSIGLSLGAGVNAVYTRINAVRAATLALDDNIDREGRIHFDASGWTGSFSIGALWEILRERLFLGVSYQAPPGLYDGMVLGAKVRTNFGAVSSVKADLHQNLPDIVRFALRYRASDYELRLFGDYQRWSVFENQCLTQRGAPCKVAEDGSTSDSVRATLITNNARQWQDSWGVRGGASYWFTPRWELLGAIGWDGNAVPDAMLEPAYPDGHDLSFQLGVRYEIGTRVSLSLAYTAIYFLQRDTSGKSRLDELMSPSNLPTGDGKYDQLINLFNTFVQVYFD